MSLAFSNQLMEHLHEEDAKLQLQCICQALVQGGVYVCLTPHRFSGPHDISASFDLVATGFHLHEYTCKELSLLFFEAGFSTVSLLAYGKGFSFRLPLWAVIPIENALSFLPYKARKKLAGSFPFRLVFNRLVVVGRK